MSARLTILLGTDNAALPREQWPVAIFFPETERGRPLHPSKHGDLADRCLASVFGAMPDGCVTISVPGLLVCTHSDVFVLRVQRRIAERTLRPEDVAFVFVEPDGTEVPIAMSDTGHPKHGPWLSNGAALDDALAMARIDLERERRVGT